jgi:transcriptional regulator with XRE-family HTH domain
MKMSIANNIKNLRELKNLTQEHMAAQLEISQRAYSKMERGETDVPFSRLEQIAKALDMNILDIVGFDDSKMFFSISKNKPNNQSNVNGLVVNTGIAEKEKILYEQIIQQQKEEIVFLRNLLNNK